MPLVYALATYGYTNKMSKSKSKNKNKYSKKNENKIFNPYVVIIKIFKRKGPFVGLRVEL